MKPKRQCNALVHPCPICGKRVDPFVPVCVGPHPGLTWSDFVQMGVIETT